jgi:PleD family two-component response regulator
MDRKTFNAPRARIACVSADGILDEELTESLKHAGYLVVSPGSAPADLSLVDLRGKSVPAKKAKAIVSLLRQKSPESSIFFLIDPALDARSRAALKRFGEIVPAGNEFDHLVERCRQIIRLRNVADEAGERMKTLAALNRLVEFPPISTSAKSINVLIAGAPGATAMAVISAAGKVAGKCVCVISAGQTLRAIDTGAFDCAIFLPSSEDNALFSVTRAIRRHPKYAGLPIIHVAEDKDGLKHLTQRGATEFILHQHVTHDLGLRIQISGRRARLLRSMRSFLQSCNGDGVRDAASGAFTSAFLSEHGARLCARADHTGRPMSVALIRLSCHNSDVQAPERKALHRAAQLINRITRAEDLTARIAPDAFVVLCPATIAPDARKLAMRIEGVIANTVFRGAKEHSLHAITAETTACARTSGAAIEETVASVIKAAQQKAAAKSQRQFPQ